jgi:hypothetical protein
MEGSEAYDVVEDVEVEINEVIEENILDNEDIDIDYDVFIDEDVVEGNVQELGDVSSPEGDTHLHLSQFVSRTFHVFTERSYTYMISYLQHEIEATGEGVLSVEPSFVKCNLSLVVAHREALKKWRKLENSLRVAQHNDHMRLFHKNVNISHLVIPFFEECENIVYEAHTSKIPHHGMNATQNIINKRGWLVGSPHYGIPNKYIKEFCLQCPLCSSKKRPSPIKRKNITTMKLFMCLPIV